MSTYSFIVFLLIEETLLQMSFCPFISACLGVLFEYFQGDYFYTMSTLSAAYIISCTLSVLSWGFNRRDKTLSKTIESQKWYKAPHTKKYIFNKKGTSLKLTCNLRWVGSPGVCACRWCISPSWPDGTYWACGYRRAQMTCKTIFLKVVSYFMPLKNCTTKKVVTSKTSFNNDQPR